MSITPEKKEVIDENGFDIDRIEQKAERLRSTIEERGFDPEDVTVLPYFDMNGPIVDKESTDYTVHSGVKSAMQRLDEVSDVPLAMLSGWDINTLDFVSEQRLDLDMDHVGELGGTAMISGEQHITVEADYDEIVDFRREMWLNAGTEEIVLQEQGNIGPVTGATYGEGARADLYNNPIAEDSKARFSEKKFYEKLLENGADRKNVTFEGDSVRIELGEDRNVNSLSHVLTNEYPLIGLLYESTGDQAVTVTENSEHVSEVNDGEFLTYFQDFIDDVAEGRPFETDHNPDFSTDYQRNDLKVSKEDGANYRAEQILDGEYIITNIGDKEGDILREDNGVFFAQEGMPAEEKREEIDNETLVAEDAGEYALTVAELLEGR